jgi:hypothetical protein
MYEKCGWAEWSCFRNQALEGSNDDCFFNILIIEKDEFDGEMRYQRVL